MRAGNSSWVRWSISVAATALVVSSGVVASASTSEAAVKKASVAVFHAIPAGLGVDVVDVYADGARIINNLKSGQLKTVRVPQGNYDIEIFVDGQTPRNDDPALSIDNVTFLAGTCSTVTANLNATGTPTTNVFANCVARNPKGEGRVTVRHIAAAPAVDVLANGETLFGNVINGAAATSRVPAQPYSVAVILASNGDPVLGPDVIAVSRPFNTIVYVWGSAADGTLATKVQRIPTIRR